MGWIILLAILGGAVPTFSKIALEVFPPYTYLFLRFLVASIILLPIFIKAKEKIAKKDIKKVILISLLGTGNVLFFSLGVRYTSATASQLLYAIVPIIVVIFSALILKTRVSKQTVFGILLGLVGVIVITLIPNLGKATENIGTLLGNGLVLLAVISYALYTVFSKKLQEENSPIALTTMMALTTIVSSSLLIPFDIHKYSDAISNLSVGAIVAILYIGIIGTALYFLLFQRVIKKTNPIVASTLFYLLPVCTFLWSYILINEKLTISLLIGSIFILCGAGVVNYSMNNVKNNEIEK